MDLKLEKANEGERNSQLISSGLSNLPNNLEAFALDLVRLIRGMLYPSKHPSFLGVAEKVVAGAPVDSTGSLTIGVTPTELVVSGEFVGGKARLAGILHAESTPNFLVRTYPQRMSRCLLDCFNTDRGTELRQKLRSEGFTALIWSLELRKSTVESGLGDDVQRTRKLDAASWISLLKLKLR
jgi:hypothetical protein